jgi:aspartate-semialdehyde dehydrogenase
MPFILDEEGKLETETQKALGLANKDVTGLEDQHIEVSAACNRVPVLDGHTACFSLKSKNRPPPSVEDATQVMREYVPEALKLGCRINPQNFVVVMEEPDRPQQRLDRETDRRYAVCVG